ncbi:hypothetical protein BGAL_0355g00090 [Botrytis galanthina]|uniref:Uncharacterized protein n=1 Tax=Botrytis galanthina TaxID=278940 RepID=A0A4S8QQ62_9HELO|nr:hypothetical protein BGAL_0355g00090 [Botrytis galanthina]
MSYQVRWGSWLQLLSEESRGKTTAVDSWEMGSECWKLGLLGSHMDEAKYSAWLARLESRVKFQATRTVFEPPGHILISNCMKRQTPSISKLAT